MKRRTVIIKLGTNVVTTHRNEVDSFRLGQIAKQVHELQENSFAPLLVVSGAVAVGLQETKLTPTSKINKQLAAGVGQAKLFNQLYSAFMQKRIRVAQFLLTQQDLDNKAKNQQLRNVVKKSLALCITPVFNENDVLSLYSFGGNDFLAEKIAQLVSATYVIILTDVDGLLDLPQNASQEDFKKAKVVPTVTHVTSKLKQKIQPTIAKNGTGGMQAKVAVANHMQKLGIKTIIANGKIKDILTRVLLNKEKIGTHFIAKKATSYKSN